MITIMKKPDYYSGNSLEQEFAKYDHSIESRTLATINILKQLPINGCITGSCWLDDYDPEIWGSDIDVFVYSEPDLRGAIHFITRDLKMEPGNGTDRSKKQEKIKLDMLFMNYSLNHKTGITTYKFNYDGVIVNISYKKTKICGQYIPLINCPSVLMSFDMSIVMQGYDIRTHTFFDMRPENVDSHTAIPNPLRDHNCSMWNVDKWVRQFDRVIKYYNRGYDTRPMAEFYLKMIDKVIEEGYVFDNSAGQEAFKMFSEEFIEKREIIQAWLDEHKED